MRNPFRRRAKKPARKQGKKSQLKHTVLNNEIKGGIQRALTERKERKWAISRLPATMTAITLTAGVGRLLEGNQSFKEGIARIAIATAIAASHGTVIALHLSREEIKKTTKLVEMGLSEAARKKGKESERLRKFLKRHKYVIIDGKGNIVGTNRKRILGIGRLRLETKYILAGIYHPEKRRRKIKNMERKAREKAEEIITRERRKITRKRRKRGN